MDKKEKENAEIVCVSGCCSLFGLNLVVALLQENYNVRCILYKPKQFILRYTKTTEYLTSLISFYFGRLSLYHIENIMGSDNELENALYGSNYVIHIPAGFATQESNNDVLTECLDPIVQSSLKLYQSTLREARRQYTNYHIHNKSLRLIYIGTCHSADENIKQSSNNIAIDENNWNNHTDMDDPKTMAKTLAEKALWELHRSEESKQVNLEVVSLLFPTLIGPIRKDHAFTLSQEYQYLSNNSLIYDLLSGYYSSCLPFNISILDVRDAVKACSKFFL